MHLPPPFCQASLRLSPGTMLSSPATEGGRPMIAYYLPVGTDRIPGLESGETDIEPFIEEASLAEAERFDIDKAWQGIHYLLCGDPWEGAPPLSDLVLGGTELGSADYGCGPA